MSYDLGFYKKDGSKKPFTETEFKNKIGDVFRLVAIHQKNGLAVGFDVGSKTEKDYIEFYHEGEGGGYWTYCSYGVDEKKFIDFKKIVKDVAINLDLQIQDLQINEGLIDPKDFNPEDPKSNQSFNRTKNITKKIIKQLPWILPTESKHFILFFILSIDPATNKNVTLILGGGGLYGSKVEQGESIDQVVKREIPNLIGTTEYEIIQVQNFDTARDKYGNELPRYSVHIKVSYFDPAKKILKHKVRWRSF